MLFNQWHEVREELRAVCHHCFTEECSDFRPTDIEDITPLCYIFYRYIAHRRCETIAETRSVCIQWYIVYMADPTQFLQLLSTVESTHLGGE